MSQYKREIDHFNRLSHIWWGAKTKAGQKRYDHKLSLFRRLCRPMEKTKILEIGCGDGEFTRRLLKTKAKIIATDLTPGVVKRGQRLLRHPNLKFQVVNAERLPYKDDSFDIVCGISILHHLKYKKALKEAFRVLKPGGKIFFTEPNLLNPQIFIVLHNHWLRKLNEHSPDETALKRWEISQLLTKLGFSRVSVNNYDFLHPLTPPPLINFARDLSHLLETLPLVKEISGSLSIYAQK